MSTRSFPPRAPTSVSHAGADLSAELSAYRQELVRMGMTPAQARAYTRPLEERLEVVVAGAGSDDSGEGHR